MSLPSVSVIIPAYRQKSYIARCLDSVQNQSYSGPIETIVVDDGCPEQSGELAAGHPLRPKVLWQNNGGVSSARNRGIAEARGELIAFLDADDCWHRHKLERQVAQLSYRGPALSFTRFQFVGPTGQALDEETQPSLGFRISVRELFRGNFIGCSTVVVHRRCVEAVGGFPDSPDLRRAGEDYALWLKIAVRYPLVYVPQPLVDYTVHPASRAGSDPLTNFEGAVYALREFERSEGPLRAQAGKSYRALVFKRSSNMFKELRSRGAGPGLYARALRALILGLAQPHAVEDENAPAAAAET